MATMLVLYAGARATIETFRGDSIRGFHGLAGFALSTSQVVAVAMVLIAAIIIAWRLPKGLGEEIPFVPEDEEDWDEE